METKLKVKDLALIAVLTGILFAQEELLSFIPNVSLTVFLIVLYSKKLGFIKTTFIVVVHVLLDNLLFGGINLIYTPAMFLGWFLIPFLLSTFFKKVNNNIGLAFLGILFSLLYCWMFITPSVLITNVDFRAYLIGDIPFEIILALSSFLSILLLYDPLCKVLDLFLYKE